MAARSVQITIDEDLLEEIDGREETRRNGRSAIIRRALRLYLAMCRRREIDASYARGYGDGEPGPEREFSDLMGAQEWPEE